MFQTGSSDIQDFAQNRAYSSMKVSCARPLKLADENAFAKRLRKSIKRLVGIPVSIGIGQTKTLAKIATKIAKTSSEGIYNLASQADPDSVLADVNIEDVWGIGFRQSKKLRAVRIRTARDLKYAEDGWIKNTSPLSA